MAQRPRAVRVAADAIDGIRVAVPELADKVKDELDRQRIEAERKALRPVFLPDLDNPTFRLPNMIRIGEPSARFMNSPFAGVALGCISANKGLRFGNIFPDKMSAFDLSFIPNTQNGFYYVDPCDDKQYIALDNYFNYCKQKRVNELVTIAQSLGATHFKVTYMERIKLIDKKQVAVKAGGKVMGVKATANVNRNVYHNAFDSFHSEKEADFDGHEPSEPKLAYLKDDLEIQDLITMRLDNNTLKHMRAYIELSNSSLINKSIAGKIDATLKAYNFGLPNNTTITSEVEKESKTVLEYVIDF
ncbi:MAG: hypothetical protein IKR21_00180 [Oscillospiraceae bacterium]|nr:hypothetical protein [Oscillospiraceae bacterium]